MCRILAITNAKGGVGKTTTCANLGAALSAAGMRVLLIDNDPQGDLTKVMRSDPKALKYTLANLMNAVLDDTELEFLVDKTVIKGEGVHYIPANSKLAGVSNRLVALQMSSRYRAGDSEGTPCEKVMSRLLEEFQNEYDYILIDCGHSMDLLTINALAAANQAVVPVQAHYLAMEDKVTKYCRYATMYCPLLQLMDTSKKLGQLAAYEISFVEDHSLQELIYRAITENGVSISTAKAKLLRSEFELERLDAKKISEMLVKPTSKGSPQKRISVTLSPEVREYFPKAATAKQIEDTIQKALALYFKATANAS